MRTGKKRQFVAILTFSSSITDAAGGGRTSPRDLLMALAQALGRQAARDAFEGAGAQTSTNTPDTNEADHV